MCARTTGMRIATSQEEERMQIEVLAKDLVGRQAQTYAEYRLFAALLEAGFLDRIRRARLTLRRVKTAAGSAITCSVMVDVDGSDAIRIRTSGEHPYAAVNRAVKQLRMRSLSSTSRPAPARCRKAPMMRCCPLPCPEPCDEDCVMFVAPAK